MDKLFRTYGRQKHANHQEKPQMARIDNDQCVCSVFETGRCGYRTEKNGSDVSSIREEAAFYFVTHLISRRKLLWIRALYISYPRHLTLYLCPLYTTPARIQILMLNPMIPPTHTSFSNHISSERRNFRISTVHQRIIFVVELPRTRCLPKVQLTLVTAELHSVSAYFRGLLHQITSPIKESFISRQAKFTCFDDTVE